MSTWILLSNRPCYMFKVYTRNARATDFDTYHVKSIITIHTFKAIRNINIAGQDRFSSLRSDIVYLYVYAVLNNIIGTVQNGYRTVNGQRVIFF